MAARRERGLLDPDAADGREPVRPPHLRHLPATATSRRASAARRPRSPGTSSSATSTLIYDDNQISIEDDTDIAFSEDVAARYEAYGWHVQTVDWTNDGTRRTPRTSPALLRRDPEGRGGHRPAELHRAAHDHRLAGAQRAEHRQGARLRARRRRGRGHQEDPRLRPRADLRGRRRGPRAHPRGWSSAARRAQAEWQKAFDAWARRPTPSAGAARPDARPAPCPTAGPTRCRRSTADAKGVATRKASGEVLTAIAPVLPELWGGSADLAGSNNTTIEGRAVVPARRSARPRVPGRPVRPRPALRHPRARHGLDHERHRRCTAAPASTAARSWSFSDYMRPAVRLAAIMQLPVTYVWTHDSIGLGEDGPTHQPVEHLAALRAIPGLDVVRPADANETVAAWQAILEHTDRPAGLAPHPAERPDVPARRATASPTPTTSHRGGYVLLDADGRAARRASWSAPAPRSSSPSRRASCSAEKGVRARVVSMPCREWFDAQDAAYRDTVLPPTVRARVSRRGRRRPGLARDRRRRRPDRLARALRRLAPTTHASSASSASPPRPSPTPPRTASRRRQTGGRPAARSASTTEEHHDRPTRRTWPTPASRSGSTTCPASARDRQPRRAGQGPHVVGVTTNPTIFASALADGERYDDAGRASWPRGGADVDEAIVRAHHRRRPQRLRRAAPTSTSRPTASTAGSRSRSSPAWPTTPTRPSPRPRRRCGRAVDRPNLLHQDPGDRGGPARRSPARLGRGHQRQRHADLRPRALPRGDGRLPRRARAGQGRRRRPVDDPLGRVVLRLPRRHRGRQAAGRDRHRRGAAPARQGRASPTPASPTRRTRRSSRPSAVAALARGRRPRAAAAVGLDRRQGPALPRHQVRHRPRRRRHRQHDAGEDPRGLRRPRRGAAATRSPAGPPTPRRCSPGSAASGSTSTTSSPCSRRKASRSSRSPGRSSSTPSQGQLDKARS